jgi:outer membrane immunogenic protein
MKLHLLCAILALAAMFIFTSSHVAYGQTGDKTDNSVDKSTVVAKTTFSDPIKTTVPAFPDMQRKRSSSPDWSGFYAGGYAGVSLARATANTSAVGPNVTPVFSPAVAAVGRQTLRPNRFTGGGTFGYNHQSNNWIVGAETDFGVLTGTSTAATPFTLTNTPFTLTQTMKTSWLWTARPRVGWTSGHALFYVTGGLSVTRLNYQATITGASSAFSFHENGGLIKTKVGFNGGGGIEYKLGDKWSVKGEYLYSDFGRSTITSTNLTQTPPPTTFPNDVFTHSIFLIQHDLRFGFNYHF